jgi:predicted type IV restriction endonuclease
MFVIPAKVNDRLNVGIKKFKKIIATAKDKDLNESDTVTIITDFLNEVMGYDKYSEITSEYAIRNTYCDLAIKLDDKVKLLIECKSIGTTLQDNHIRQAVNYGSNEGIEWIALTNGDEWRIFKLAFKKPITEELVAKFILSDINLKSEADKDALFCLTHESLAKSKTNLSELYSHKALLNKFMIGQLILEDSTITLIRKHLKKISPDLKIANDAISSIIINEVLKREILAPEDTKDVRRIIKKKLSPAPTKKDNATDLPHDDAEA